ncbi:reverse transcriptase domain-containing protein, partial [Tanacetum coccineum]
MESSRDHVSDPTLYRSLAGGLQYLTFTHPDISYAVQQICLDMHDPLEPHLAALKRILCYVRGTLDFGLQLFAFSTGNPVQHQRTKHIEIDIHFVRDMVTKDQVRVLHVTSHYQYDDIFSKGLPSALFGEFRTSLSVRCSSVPTAGECRRHIDIESHRRDLQLEVRRERYSRSKLLFQNLQILFKVDFDQGFEGLRLSSFARVLGLSRDREAEVFQVSNDDTAVSQRRLEDKQLEEKTHTDFLVNEQEKVHLGIKVEANITVTGVPGQEGEEEGDDKLPVIIAKDLKDEEKAALLKVLKSHKRAIAWKLSDIKGVSPEFCTHKILMEEDYEPSVQSQRRVNPKIHDVIKKEVEKLLDAGLIYPISDSPWVSPVHCVPKKGGMTVITNEENELIPTRLVTGWRVCIDYRKLNEATRKDHFPLPFMDQMLERLAGNEYYCFLDGFSGYFQIPIDPKDQEKTTFTCPYGTFAYRRMPFGLCNAPGTFQRCMLAIFHDMVEKTMEVFMDDFSV